MSPFFDFKHPVDEQVFLPQHYPATAVSSRSQYPPSRLHLTPLHSSPGILIGGTGASSTTTHSSHSYHVNQASPSPVPLPAAHVTHKTLQGQQHQQQRLDKTGPAATAGYSGSTSGSAKATHSHNSIGTNNPHNKSNSSVRMLSKSASSIGQQGGPIGGRSLASTLKPSDHLRESSQSTDLISLHQDVYSDTSDHIHNPELLLTSSADCDDLCALPPPKKVLPKRELPWVFRYKVKRGMNTLSKIMASKPPQSLIHSSQAFT
ncbi:hypothetical protein PoB_000503200 [Plakobranchus ocellatus]|uniref:Uncharacterized protein n=1 Tax=Plakobranchus ocellatus TaxID=259542 RepID=A0AAV3Y6U9_9GAST|nr:hypothetical protein PoB_000503200 [Plakobranchus ocellatus]